MNELTPLPPSDRGLQLLEPMPNRPAPPAGSKFRLHKFLFFLRRFWWIPVITLILGGASAVFWFYHTPPIFVSEGSMWESEKLRLPDGADFISDRENYIGTLTDLLRSPALQEKTTTYLAAFHTNQIIRDERGNIIPVDIQVNATPKSSVYRIQARCSNPAFTSAYLNALMEQYKEYRLEARDEVSSHTASSISVEVQQYERDLRKAQAILSEYERTNNFSVLREESTADASYLAAKRTELADYDLQLKMLTAKELEADSGLTVSNASESVLNSLRNSGNQAAPIAGPQEADRQLALLKLERERLLKNLRATHPKIVKLDADIARAEKLIELFHQQNHDQVAALRQALQIKIENVTQAITNLEARVADSNERLTEADDLKLDVASKQRMYDRLTTLSDNVQVSQHIEQDTLEILEQASPARRSYTEAKTILAQSIILGLGVGFGLVLLLAMRDDRFGSLGEVTERFGDNVLGQVPEVPRLSQAEPVALLMGNDERHVFAESYRNLRSALLYLAVNGQRPKLLLITSAVPAEGKSTVATNLARAMALGGSKVLLIDGDLRKGHLHSLLELQSKPGLSDLLSQNGDLADFIQPTDLANFSFLARGNRTLNPGDLLLSPAFAQLLTRARQAYDYVLIDSSPVFAADDTTSIAPLMDGSLFVVRSQFSHARIIHEALELLFQRQAPVLGLILNRASPTSRSYHFYKYAEYYARDNGVEVESDG